MGVDFDGVGGIGFNVNDYLELLSLKDEFKTLWDTDCYEAVELLCKDTHTVTYSQAGDCYTSGGTYFYVFVKGNTLQDIQDNLPDFIYHFRTKWGISFDTDTLQVISDILVS